MPRSYRHMQNYEKEILELKTQGLTQRQKSSPHSCSYTVTKAFNIPHMDILS